MQKKLRRRDKSTVNKWEYVSDHIFLGGIFAYNVYNLLPVVCPIAQAHQSLIRLIICMVLSSFAGIALSYKYNRTNRGMFMDVLLGGGLYVLLTIGVYKATFVKILFIVCALFSVLGIYSIMSQRIKRPDKKKQIILNRIKRSFLVVRRNAGLACGVALVVVPVAVHFTSLGNIAKTDYEINGIEATSTQYADEYEVHEVYDDRYRLSENIDVIKKIRTNEEFQSLSYDEKCEVVRALLYCEARYLGLEEINLEFKELRDTTLGQYDHSTRTITINSKPLKDGSLNGGSNEEVAMTVLHEARHYYQHLLTESYIAATPEQRNLYAYTHEGVSYWLENFNDYKTAEDECSVGEYMAYRSQPIEEDARYWASTELTSYFFYIDEELRKPKFGNE